MVRQIAFVLPLEHGWYRYHQLFAETMQLVLRHENPGMAAGLHRRAAAWFDREGMLADAVRHATLAQDWQFACWLVVERMAVGQLLGLGVDSPPARWFRSMPAAVVTAGVAPEPAIVAAAEALSRGDDQACQRALRWAERALSPLPDDHARAARLAAGVIRIARAHPADLPTVERVADQARKLLRQMPEAPSDPPPELSALLLAAGGRADLWAGRLAGAAEAYAAALEAATAAGGNLQRYRCLGSLALVEALRGRFRGPLSWSPRAQLPGRARSLRLHLAAGRVQLALPAELRNGGVRPGGPRWRWRRMPAWGPSGAANRRVAIAEAG